jgi:hypothetical protein
LAQFQAKESTEIPDDVYDELESELRRLDPTHPVLSKVGYDVQPVAGKVTHFPPMLSLEKSYDPQDIEKFIDQMGIVCFTDKMDGMALALEYGRGGQLIRASTRGNGVLGENVTAHVLLVPGIPKRLELDCLIVAETQGNLIAEVRGEVYFPFAAFERHSDRFESFRNAVPGTFGRKEPQEAADILAGFEFCAYDVLFRMSTEDGAPSSAGAVNVIADASRTASLLGLSVSSHLEKLRQLEKLGFWAGVGDHRTFALTLADISAQGLSVDAFLRAQMGAKRPYAVASQVKLLEPVVLSQMGGELVRTRLAERVAREPDGREPDNVGHLVEHAPVERRRGQLTGPASGPASAEPRGKVAVEAQQPAFVLAQVGGLQHAHEHWGGCRAQSAAVQVQRHQCGHVQERGRQHVETCVAQCRTREAQMAQRAAIVAQPCDDVLPIEESER